MYQSGLWDSLCGILKQIQKKVGKTVDNHKQQWYNKTGGSGAASRIGFNRASVTQWKNSGNPPKQELLLKIASYFNVSVDYLLTGREQAEPDRSVELDGLEFALFGEVRDMTEAQKRDVLKFAQFIKEKGE